MSPIELRDGCAFEKCQAVKVGKRIGDVVVSSVNFSYPVNWLHFSPVCFSSGPARFRERVNGARPLKIICS